MVRPFLLCVCVQPCLCAKVLSSYYVPHLHIQELVYVYCCHNQSDQEQISKQISDLSRMVLSGEQTVL
jgi:hypothetical protein